MDSPQVTDEIRCKAFARTFSGKARQWYDDLPRGSITCLRDLVESFLSHFFQLKKLKKTYADLMNIRQGNP